MTGAWTFFDFMLLACGYAACWFTKDFILKVFMGADGFVKKLEAKAAAIKDTLSK